MVAIYYDQFAGAMSERQAEEANENIVRGLDNLMQADPDHTEIKRSLRHIRSRHPKAFDLNPEFFEAILDVPAADLFVDDCPHCSEPVMAEKRYSGEMVCPECNRSVYSDGSSYSRSSTHGGSTTTSTTRSSSTNEDCFVATAVYGDYEHPDVRRLRRFRDETLRHAAWGRAFIAWYYRYGPGLAERLEGRHALRRGIRWALAQFVERGLR
jgi:hypothetical protein